MIIHNDSWLSVNSAEPVLSLRSLKEINTFSFVRKCFLNIPGKFIVVT